MSSGLSGLLNNIGGQLEAVHARDLRLPLLGSGAVAAPREHGPHRRAQASNAETGGRHNSGNAEPLQPAGYSRLVVGNGQRDPQNSSFIRRQMLRAFLQMAYASLAAVAESLRTSTSMG